MNYVHESYTKTNKLYIRITCEKKRIMCENHAKRNESRAKKEIIYKNHTNHVQASHTKRNEPCT